MPFPALISNMIPVHTNFMDRQSGLVDSFGRGIEYVRLSVTDKRNLRCFYCLLKGFRDFETPQYWLSFDEVARIMLAFSEPGVMRVRSTGGEPLLRKSLRGMNLMKNRGRSIVACLRRVDKG